MHQKIMVGGSTYITWNLVNLIYCEEEFLLNTLAYKSDKHCLIVSDVA